jgi:hypothetical protein
MRHPDFPGYDISEDGRVTSLFLNREITGSIDKNGYRVFTLLDVNKRRKHTSLHRLLAEVFIPNPHHHPNVLHWDDDKQNNSLSNLRWGTQAHNAADSIRNGTLVIPDNAMSWRVLSPSGEVLTTDNLTQFCREHGLDKRNLHRSLKGIRHRGYTLLGKML